MQVIHGDCLIEMSKMETNSIDFIITDPPYGLHFMGKNWDGKIPSIEIWGEALRVCKPGAMIAAFGGTRTQHRLTCAIEDAGWEIKDVIMWVYGQGFPKSHNHFGLEGYGTALKPAYEPIILAMKSLEGTYKQNIEKWGVAGINIDAGRIGINPQYSYPNGKGGRPCHSGGFNQNLPVKSCKGRWPANIILDEVAAKILDKQSGLSSSSKSKTCDNRYQVGIYGNGSLKGDRKSENSYDDKGGPSRFFYCAKASSSERNRGLEGMLLKNKGMENGTKCDNTLKGSENALHPDKNCKSQNFHPTVKPLSLMRYLIKLLAPPGNPTLLDPFAGSGSTLLAAKELGINAIGIEKEAEYCEIANKRIDSYIKPLEQFEFNYASG